MRVYLVVPRETEPENKDNDGDVVKTVELYYRQANFLEPYMTGTLVYDSLYADNIMFNVYKRIFSDVLPDSSTKIACALILCYTVEYDNKCDWGDWMAASSEFTEVVKDMYGFEISEIPTENEDNEGSDFSDIDENDV